VLIFVTVGVLCYFFRKSKGSPVIEKGTARDAPKNEDFMNKTLPKAPENSIYGEMTEKYAPSS
jgi:hypothetical protein